MVFEKNLIISVDGYSSCGKSTFASSLAEKLGYLYIDSGAMYRAVTISFLTNNVIAGNQVNRNKMTEILKNVSIRFIYNEKTGKSQTYLNGNNVENEIRSVDIANNVSMISKIDEVREVLVSMQRDLGKNKRIVMDGRDIGTVVFPDAELKIFMTAGLNIRAERRFKELSSTQDNITLESVKENLIKRDYIDVNRSKSPLKMANDAILLDNSNMTPGEQLSWGINLINQKFRTNIE